MSDFLSKLKGIFVHEVGADGKPVEKPSEPQPSTPSAKPNVVNTQVSIPTGKATDQFFDILLGAMEQNNQEGFDYLEYKKSLKTLASVPMDEQTRYFSAFAAAQAMGVSSQKLVDSAQFYSNVLKTEEDKFQAALKSQREKQVGGKEKAILDLGATIKAKADQIAKLTEEIKTHQTDMEKMKSEISDAVVKIETTSSDFTTTYQELLAQIQKDIENMKKYLK